MPPPPPTLVIADVVCPWMSNEWPQGAPPKIPKSVAEGGGGSRTAELLRRLKKIATFNISRTKKKKDIECKAANFDFRGTATRAGRERD